MKRLRFLPALLLILSACSETIIGPGSAESGKMGSVSIALSTDMRNDEVGTKAGPDGLNVDDFRVAIYKQPKNVRLYNDSYANTEGREITLNSGNYRLVAQHGDSTGCGFGKPYYLADQLFKVEGPGTMVSATAKLANVKLAVKYDASISGNQAVYADYYTVIKRKMKPSDGINKELSVKFSRTENRYGYIPAGDLALEIWAKIDGVWKYYETSPATYNPNEFVTFTISTDTSQGSLTVNIKVDNSVEDKPFDIEIPAIATPQSAPFISLEGFEGADNSHAFVEGVTPASGAVASFEAKGSIAHCYLTVDSEYLASKGISGQYDFADLQAGDVSVLESLGFAWDGSMATSRKLSYIDFSGFVSKLLEDTRAKSQDETIARFTLRVEDSVAKSAETSFCIISSAVNHSVSIPAYNVWAKRIVSPTITVDNGNPSLFKLQVSTDRRVWTDLNGTPAVDGNTLTYGTYSGTAPGASYFFRSVYNGNEGNASPIVEVRTEETAQLGNSGFEDYQLVKTEFTPAGGALGGGKYTRNWYLPYASGESDPWWACNSMKSMPDGHTGWTSTWCKNFPSSGYVKGAHSGSKAAMLYCVNVGGGNTDGTAVGTTTNGEIWIGTADGSGNQETQGHAFASRPSKLAFWYKYTATNGKKFYVETWIKDASGNVIAASKETAGPAADNWTKYELPFNYSNLQAKAASIYVWISSAFEDGSVSTGVSFDLGEESVKAHAGCFLTIDDIELIYE